MDVAAVLEELVRLEAYTARLVARSRELRDELLAEALRQAEVTGSAVTWRVKDKGTVSLVAAAPAVALTSEALFAEWVKADHPDWIVPRVDAIRAQGILREAVHDPAGNVMTPEGERIPGVSVVTRAPQLRIRLEPAAKAAAAEAVPAGVDG